jgi:hypothetical protein
MQIILEAIFFTLRGVFVNQWRAATSSEVEKKFKQWITAVIGYPKRVFCLQKTQLHGSFFLQLGLHIKKAK